MPKMSAKEKTKKKPTKQDIIAEKKDAQEKAKEKQSTINAQRLERKILRKENEDARRLQNEKLAKERAEADARSRKEQEEAHELTNEIKAKNEMDSKKNDIRKLCFGDISGLGKQNPRKDKSAFYSREWEEWVWFSKADFLVVFDSYADIVKST